MKVLLVSPPLRNMQISQVRARGCMPPLDLMYLASYLAKYGHEADILDLYARRFSSRNTLDHIRRYSPGLIGFATYTPNIEQVFSISAMVKSAFPGIKIVLGGIHASYLSDVCLADKNVDFIVRGEGEETLLELVEALEGKRQLQGIKGLSYRNEGEIVSTENRPLIKDLDSLPLPAYQLIDFKKYYLAITRAVSGKRAASLLTMRGCPYSCSFCSHHYGYGNLLRKRSLESVMDEFEYLYRECGVREFQIEDSSFTCDPQRAVRLCAMIEASGLNFTWNCNIRADTASEELFSAMSRAGCRRVLLGVESGSDELLKRMKKGITIEQARNAVSLAKKFNMRINCAFIIGTPGETASSAEKSFRLAKELDPDYVMFSVLIPSVGSEFFDKAVSEGKVQRGDVKGADFITVYSEREPVIEMSHLGRKEMISLMERFTRGFYSRPIYVLKKLCGIKSLGELRRLFWGMALVFSHQARMVCSMLVKGRTGRKTKDGKYQG